MATKKQFRGVCCVCGKDQAVNTANGLIVPHGYTLDYGFFNGVCEGANNVHYGHNDAVDFLNDFILSIEKRRAHLPARINGLREDLELEESTGKKNKIEFHINQLEYQHDKQLPMLIEYYLDRRIAWDKKEPVEYDIEKVTEQKRLERAEAKKIADAAKAAKKAAQKIREEKAAINAAKRETVLLANNYHRLIMFGEFVREWEASYPTERAMIDDHHAIRQAEYDKLPEPKERLNWYIGSIYIDVRSKANNKGRMLRKGSPYA